MLLLTNGRNHRQLTWTALHCRNKALCVFAEQQRVPRVELHDETLICDGQGAERGCGAENNTGQTNVGMVLWLLSVIKHQHKHSDSVVSEKEWTVRKTERE